MSEQQEQERVAVCPQCPQRYEGIRATQSLGRHLRYSHGVKSTSKKTLRNKQYLTNVYKPGKDGKFKCPECGLKYPRASELGLHRKLSHHVDGTSQAVLSKRRQKEAGVVSEATPSQAIAMIAKEPLNGTRKYSKQSNGHASLEIVAYAIGQIKALVDGIAYQNEIPGKQFARQCAEYFQMSTSR